MFRAGIAALSLIAVCAAGLPLDAAHARPDVVLSPTSPWNLDVTDAGCALRRKFGPADHPLMLEFRRFRPGDRFQLVVDGDQLSGLIRRSSVTVQYGTLGEDKDSSFQGATTKRDDQRDIPAIMLSSALAQSDKPGNAGKQPGALAPVDVVTPEMEAGVDHVALVWTGNRVVIRTGSLGKPFAAMRSCTDALLKDWGLDPAVQNTLTKRAKPANLLLMVRSIQSFYPMNMAAQGKQARVNFRALVDAQGIVTQCRIMQSYNDPSFDDLACKVVQKTRFDPALDKDGHPVASFYVETVIYSMS